MSQYCGRNYRDGSGEPCGLPAGWGTDHPGEGACKLHGGNSPGGPGPGEHNANAVTHGLHQTPETFLAHADERHRDTYHAIFEALCSRFEFMHSREPDYANKQELKHGALDMVKQDLGTEYMKAHAVDPEQPLTDEQLADIDGRISVEKVSIVADLLTHLKRENRLRMKEMGLYHDPESEKADAMRELNVEIRRARYDG